MTGAPEAPRQAAQSTRTVDAWYREQLSRLGEMTTEDADLTNGREWRFKRRGRCGQIRKVVGAHFTLVGRWVVRHNLDGSVGFRWVQPGLFANEKDVTIPTPDGPMVVPASGLVGLLADPDGRVLLTLGQEPFARTEKCALARTPMQTSAAKLEGLLAGDRRLDPTMYDLLTELAGPGRSFADAFSGGAVSLFTLAPADANRISASNVGFVARVNDPALRERLTADGRNRWCDPADVTWLMQWGLLNGFTAGALAYQLARRATPAPPAAGL